MYSSISHALAAAAVAVACAAASARADAAETGAFVEGSISHARNDDGLHDVGADVWRAGVGYRWAITPGVALGFELGYADLGGVQRGSAWGFRDGVMVQLPYEFSAKGPALGLDARFDVAPGWFVGARIGMQRADYTLRPAPPVMPIADDNGWYAGASIGHDFGEAWSIGVGYERIHVGFGSGDIDSDRFGMNAEYRF